MKVLMLGWELPPHNSGGLGVACLNLARALTKEGADIDFVVPYEADNDEYDFMNILSATSITPQAMQEMHLGAYDDLAAGPAAADSPSGALEMRAPVGDPPAASPAAQPSSIREVQRDYCKFVNEYLMEFKPDVVHAHDWLTFEAGVLAKKNYGVPLIAHVHATEYDRSGMHGGNPVVHEIEREGLLMADKIIAVSQATRKIIHDKYDIPLEKIDVVYNSLDEGFLRSAYSYDSDDYRYLEAMKGLGYTIVSTVGRFTVQKGLVNMMRAAAKALRVEPKLIFVFAGDGEQRGELVELSAKYGISRNVVFTGFVRGKQLRDIYTVSDIFVMSSISEPFGLTALEAAHHGDALILTKQSGVAEVLRSAMEYDFWDEDKLADEIVAIARSEGLQKTLRSGIAHEYQKISWNKVAEKVIRVYNEVDKHKRNRVD